VNHTNYQIFLASYQGGREKRNGPFLEHGSSFQEAILVLLEINI
jgi:hypothetical protein